MKIGFQGIEGAFSSIASRQLFPDAEYISFKSFYDVLDAITNDIIDCGILPIENSYAGRVAGMHNLFKDFCDKKLFIVAEKLLKVEHCLGCLEGAKIDDITNIFSHEQALMQCQKNISKLLPNAKCLAKENTAMSAQFVVESRNKHYSVICSKDACEKYGLHILYSNFQDSNDNCTLFVGLSKKQNAIPKKTNNVITSLLFELNNTSGSLYRALGCFAEQGIDMMKIESYIPTFLSTSAMFFITIRGNLEDDNVKKAMNDLSKFTKNIYSFGSYFADGKRR